MSARTTAAKESAIVSRARLRQQRGAIERWTALVVLFFSFAGTIAALAGGWPALITDPRVAPILGGLALQGLLTYLQWHYYDKRLISRPSRIADAALTALGYGPLVLSWLMEAITERIAAGPDAPPSDLPWYLAWAVIVLVSYGVAWYPESRLID